MRGYLSEEGKKVKMRRRWNSEKKICGSAKKQGTKKTFTKNRVSGGKDTKGA